MGFTHLWGKDPSIIVFYPVKWNATNIISYPLGSLYGISGINMHILLIHQAFASLSEPGGTRHYELARFLVEKGHQITVVASPVSYLTGKTNLYPWITKRRPCYDLKSVYLSALRRSFITPIQLFSFMLSSFFR
jgi:hypothetical protein